MRRDMRRNQNDDNFDTKKILYITGAIFVLAIIIFAIVFYMYNKQWNEDYEEIGQINSIAEDYEETSSSFGKTVNESQNEITENNIDKIAVNTSKMEETAKNEDTANNSRNSEQSLNSNSNKNTNNEESNSSKSNSQNNEGSESVKANKEDSANKKTENKSTEKNAEDTKKEKEEAKNPVFQMPVEGEIVKKFAKTNLVYSNTLGEWVTHNGIDIKADKTTVVKASESGTVKSIKNDPRYGLTIIIEHTNDCTTVYSNLLSTEFVVVGEKVEKGQTIGTVGNTATFEIADEPHLHFEILHNSENLDPELYFK